jgi:hypothetical protein
VYNFSYSRKLIFTLIFLKSSNLRKRLHLPLSRPTHSFKFYPQFLWITLCTSYVSILENRGTPEPCAITHAFSTARNSEYLETNLVKSRTTPRKKTSPIFVYRFNASRACSLIFSRSYDFRKKKTGLCAIP